jgi:predicted RNase H-like HicB family nuclease
MDITVETHAEGDGYWAEVRELPGCFASAGTLSELREALAEAVGLYLWDVPAEIGDAWLEVGVSRLAVAEPT